MNMGSENGLDQGVVFGELSYAGKSLDVDPLIDRVGEDAAALSVYSTRLHFYISTARDIVEGVQEVRVVAQPFLTPASGQSHPLTLPPPQRRVSWMVSWIVLVCGQMYQM
jgi:hypothetical protein